MDLDLQNYLRQLTDKNINKDNIIINIGLLIEKNISENNPTDYSLLLPSVLIKLSLTSKDVDEIVDSLLILLKNDPSYSSRIVWAIGKTFDEKKVELLLLTIIQIKQCDEETFKQIKFLIDVVKNKRIIQLFDEIILLRDKY